MINSYYPNFGMNNGYHGGFGSSAGFGGSNQLMQMMQVMMQVMNMMMGGMAGCPMGGGAPMGGNFSPMSSPNFGGGGCGCSGGGGGMPFNNFLGGGGPGGYNNGNSGYGSPGHGGGGHYNGGGGYNPTGRNPGAFNPSDRYVPSGSGQNGMAPSISGSGQGADAARWALGMEGISERNNPGAVRSISNGAWQPWCADFVSQAYRNSGGSPFGHQSSVAGILGWGRQNDRFFSARDAARNPGGMRVGDVAVWKQAGRSHVGLVTGVNPDGTFNTIEGNSGDAVRRRTHSFSGRGLTGFVRPRGSMSGPGNATGTRTASTSGTGSTTTASTASSTKTASTAGASKSTSSSGSKTA
jgi:hypothetical protein